MNNNNGVNTVAQQHCSVGPQHCHPQPRTTSLQSSSLISKTSVNVLTHIRLKEAGELSAVEMLGIFNIDTISALQLPCTFTAL